jgi:hypothetical protein
MIAPTRPDDARPGVLDELLKQRARISPSVGWMTCFNWSRRVDRSNVEAAKEKDGMTRSMILVLLVVAFGQTVIATTAVAGAFDGVYTGAQREVQNDNSGFCRNVTRDNVHVTVAADVIKYQWGQLPLETTVRNDGSFSVDRTGLAMRGASPTVSLKGRISGGNLEADVGGIKCSAHLSLKKS